MKLFVFSLVSLLAPSADCHKVGCQTWVTDAVIRSAKALRVCTVYRPTER